MRADDDVDRRRRRCRACTSAASFAGTMRESCATFTGSPAKRSEKVRKCWRASSVVGTTTATCAPDIAATKAARNATSVLPKPTSPQISRSIGRPDARSSSTSAMARAWSSVSANGKRAQNSSQAPSRRRHASRRRASARSAAMRISSAAMSRMRLFISRLARLPGDAAQLVERHALLPRCRSATAPRCSRPAGTASRRRRRSAAGSRAARR